MAVIRSTYQHPTEAVGGQQLLAELAHELTAPPDTSGVMRQPIVLEQELSSTSLRVAVVWEKWRLVSAGERSRIIIDAYRSVWPDRAETITIAIGATTSEAISLGLLPYGIVATVEQGKADPESVRALLRSEGAVSTPDGLLLQFPTLEAANASYNRLLERAGPKGHDLFALVKTEWPASGI